MVTGFARIKASSSKDTMRLLLVEETRDGEGVEGGANTFVHFCV